MFVSTSFFALWRYWSTLKRPFHTERQVTGASPYPALGHPTDMTRSNRDVRSTLESGHSSFRLFHHRRDWTGK